MSENKIIARLEFTDTPEILSIFKNILSESTRKEALENLNYYMEKPYVAIAENISEKRFPNSLNDFWKAQAKWSQETFGSDKTKGPLGPLKHLAKEAMEAHEHPKDLMEYVDCLFLICDATRRAGFTLEQLLDGAWQKLEINKSRTWPKANGDEPVEHIE